VRETGDGTVLIHCFAGCAPTEIVAAVGLKITDLFPPRDDAHRHRPVPRHLRHNYRELLRLLRKDMTVTLVAAGNMACGVELSDADRARLRRAAWRIINITEVIDER
jgi:hypothetical protein